MLIFLIKRKKKKILITGVKLEVTKWSICLKKTPSIKYEEIK